METWAIKPSSDQRHGAVIKKFTAAAAAAFFSNSDVVSIEAENASDKAEVLSAAIVKALINYRLRKARSLVSNLPWWLQGRTGPGIGLRSHLLGSEAKG